MRKILLTLFALLAFACGGKAQVSLQIRDSTGTILGTFPSGLVNLKCGSNMTCTVSSNTVLMQPSGGGGGGGSLSSVQFIIPNFLLNQSSSTVAGVQTTTFSLMAQGAGTFFAGPVSGVNATPTFRNMVLTDIPPAGAGTFCLNSVNSVNQWLSCSGGGGGGGGGFTNPMTTLADIITGGAGGNPIRLGAAAGIDGIVYTLGEVPASGVATALAWFPSGINSRTNTGTTDTLLSTGRTNQVIQNNASASAITIPAAGSAGFTGHYVTALQNLGAGTGTYAPASGTVDGGANFALLQGELAVLSSPDDINWTTRRYSPPVRCTGGGITCTPGAFSLTLSATGTASHGLSFTLGDPAGAALGTGATVTDYLTVPFACTIHAYNLAVDAGTITVKWWKVATGTAIPTSGNSINTSGVGISSGTAIHSTTLSDFTTTAVAANDILAMNVTAAATAKFVNGVIECD